MPPQTDWQRVTKPGEVHLIPRGDVIKHEAFIKCPCGPEAEHSERQGLWVVFHQRVKGEAA